MTVRLRFQLASRPITRIAVALLAAALWRLAADLQVIPWFPLASGPFSHWQPWFALSAATQAVAFWISRKGRPVASRATPPPE